MRLHPLAAVLFASNFATAAENGTYRATFTWYGEGDFTGQQNCNTNSAACGFYTYPGYSAAVSQNLYGIGPGEGEGTVCGTCWRLTIQEDTSGNNIQNSGDSIVVMVNNLCPARDPRGWDNPLCSQSSLNDTNRYGGVVDFNLCSDDGARAALFGTSGVGAAVGTAVQVDCNQWNGTKKYDAGSGQSSSGVIGGSGISSSQQSVGEAGQLSVWSLWLFFVPLAIVIRV